MRSFTNRTMQSALLALTATTLGVSAAEARSVPGGFVRLGSETAPPRGFVEMCASGVEPGFCSPTQPKGPSGAFATAGLRDQADAGLAGDARWGGLSVSWVSPRHAAPMADLRPAVLQGGPHGPVSSASPPVASGMHETLSPAEQKAMLQRINRNVNYRVKQRSDQEIYGVGELWRPTGIGRGAVGDCEDLAIEKRAELVAAGFPANRLAFAVVYSRAAGLHTVLVARMKNEDVVLDGRSSMIVSWVKAPYSWISVQSMDDPMIWHNAA